MASKLIPYLEIHMSKHKYEDLTELIAEIDAWLEQMRGGHANRSASGIRSGRGGVSDNPSAITR